MTTPEDADFSSKPSSDTHSDCEDEGADPLIQMFEDNFDSGIVYTFPAFHASRIKKHLKPVLPQEDRDSVEPDQPKKKSKKKVPSEAHLIDEDMLQREEARLRAEESEWDVLEMVKAALEDITGPDDPPVFLLHSQQMSSSTQGGERMTSSPREKDVVVFHRTLGIIVLEVKATENTQARSRVEEAVTQLLHALHSLQGEMGGLGNWAVSLAIALPNLGPDQAKVIRAQAEVSGDPNKATAKLGDHPEIELLCGKDLNLYRKWLQDIRVRNIGSDPYVTNPADDGDVIFKRAVCKRCSVPRYGDAIRKAAQQQERWLLTPQQMQLRDLPDLSKTVVSLIGPPGAGKTLLLIHRARRWLQEGRRVVAMVGHRMRDILLAQLGETILRGQRAGDARERLFFCTNTVQLWDVAGAGKAAKVGDAARAGHFYVVVDELGSFGSDVLFRSGLHLMAMGLVAAMWTADVTDTYEDLVLEAEALGVTVRRETLSTTLRCCQKVTDLLNVVKPDDKSPVQHHRLPSSRSFHTGVEFHFHTDHGLSTPFHSCPACRDGVTAILRSLALPGFCPQDPAPLELHDCVVILTGISYNDSEKPQSVVSMVSWLQDLGLPVVCEWEMLCSCRHTEFTLPDHSSSAYPEMHTQAEAAWRERVLKGRDQAGKTAVHVVFSGDLLGLERKAVIVAHLDDEDDDPDYQTQADQERRRRTHQEQWYAAASRCQGKLAFLVLSSSPVLHLLQQAAEQARFVPSSSLSLHSSRQTSQSAGTRTPDRRHSRRKWFYW